MNRQFSDILLQDVLDYLEMEDLLLCAMPVSRFWRQQTIGHRTYWRNICLWERRYDPRAPRYTSSLSLFLIRISRSLNKIIDVSFAWDDPDAVLGAIAQHLPYIRRLSIGADPALSNTIFAALRAAKADALEYLSLGFTECGLSRSFVFLPRDLFAEPPLALRKLDLGCVSLPSYSDLPRWLAPITSLTVTSYAPEPCPLANVFAHCLSLESLQIKGNVSLDDPAFRSPHTWASLSQLEVCGWRPEDSWNFLDPSLTVVPFIRISAGDALSTVFPLTNRMGARLAAHVHWYEQHDEARPAHGYVALRNSADRSGRRRWVDINIPLGPWRFPSDVISAFQHVSLADKIVHLVLALGNWGGLVGPGHLTHFPVLEELVLTISSWHDQPWRTQPTSAKISCPRLDRLVLRRHRWSHPPVVALGDVATFTEAALPDAPFPIVLELSDAVLAGTVDDSPGLFSCFISSRTKDYDWNN